MRLSSLRLLRYGPFEDLMVSLDPAPGRLNVICAPNGAGKSVLRQALTDLLFGIGGQTPMGFRYGYQGMRLAASAVMADGAIHEFGRRKGMGVTWTDAEGVQLQGPPAAAGAFARTDPRALERLFALDTERLRKGGDELLAAGGAVADALLSASGLSGARQRRRELEEAADQLAPLRRVANRPFYQALDQFVAARRTAAEALMRPDAWERQERTVAEAAGVLAAHRQKAEAAQALAGRLQRIRRVRVALAEHDDAAAWLAAHPEAPELPASLAPRLAEARQALAVAVQKSGAEAARLVTLQAQLREITVDTALLAEADAVDRLAEMAGQVTKALTDIPQLGAELAQVNARIGRLLARLGSGAAVAEAPGLIPPRAAQAAARELINRHEARAAAAREAGDTLAAVAREIAAGRAALDALPAAQGTGELAPLVAEIRKQGDPAAQAEEISDAVARGQAALEAALRQVSFWQGDAGALQALEMPAEAMLGRAHQALMEAEAALRRQEDALAAAVARHAAATERVSEGGDVPSRSAIAAARLHRDTLYGLLARLAFGGAPLSEAEVAVLTGGQRSAAAYEQAVLHADRLADRHAEESGRIAQAEEAARQLGASAKALAVAITAHTAAVQLADQARAAWVALLPGNMPPAARLDDVRGFMVARAKVFDRAMELRTASDRAIRLADRHAGWAAGLAEALCVPACALPGLLAAAEQLLGDAARAERERTTLEATLAEKRRQHAEAAASAEKATAALALWARDWAAALAGLGRPHGEAPAVTAEVLRHLEELGRETEQAADLSGRIGAMRTDNAAFAAGVGELAERLSHAVSDAADTGAMLALIRALRERLGAQRRLAAQHHTLTQQAEQAALMTQDLQRAQAARERAMGEILNACGAPDADTAEQLLAASATRAGHEATRNSRHAMLLAEGDGLSFEGLRAEIGLQPAETVAPALAAAELEAAAAQEAAQQAAAAHALLAAQLDQRSRDTAYASARAAEAEAAATAGRVLQEALAARLAATLLARAMARVEAAGTADLLARIGGWFARLTDGAYVRIATVENEAGGQDLVAVPADRPDEIKRMDQLSEGTRDQFYLALRLEALAGHPDALPFIADDILQTFDDARAEAALGALLELSQRTQVIVLTHHSHILRLAEKLPAGTVCIGGLVDGGIREARPGALPLDPAGQGPDPLT
jgi:uncharacterized protein YhaN